jgi:hypothetical protein
MRPCRAVACSPDTEQNILKIPGKVDVDVRAAESLT